MHGIEPAARRLQSDRSANELMGRVGCAEVPPLGYLKLHVSDRRWHTPKLHYGEAGRVQVGIKPKLL